VQPVTNSVKLFLLGIMDRSATAAVGRSAAEAVGRAGRLERVICRTLYTNEPACQPTVMPDRTRLALKADASQTARQLQSPRHGDTASKIDAAMQSPTTTTHAGDAWPGNSAIKVSGQTALRLPAARVTQFSRWLVND